MVRRGYRPHVNHSMMKARLKAAAQRAKLPGESVKPEIIERSGGTATVGVIFKKGHKSVEDISHHGSWYTQEEREKLLNATLKSLELRGKRSSTR
jgi:hypothetical protein